MYNFIVCLWRIDNKPIHMFLKFQNTKELQKIANYSHLPTLCLSDDNSMHLVASKNIFSINIPDYATALYDWLSVVFAFWVEAPPHLQMLKVFAAGYILGKDYSADCNSAQKKIYDQFISFCQK